MDTGGSESVLILENVNGSLANVSTFDDEYLRSQQTWRWELQDSPKFPKFWFENHDHLFWKKFVWEYPYYPYIACVLYLATIYALNIWMKDRQPFKLRTPLILWNLGLGIFSLFGFFRIAQEFSSVLGEEHGLHKTVCEKVGHYHPAAFWGLLFVLSKYIELGDTVFIVLKKQPLLALQWYHHCLVTVFAWVLYSWQEPILRWYALMNYGVHGVMYPYFALRGMNIKVPELFAMAITSLQVVQMILGVSLNLYAMYDWAQGGNCSRNPHSVAFSLLTYASLWFMFVQFFLAKYISRTRKKNKAD